jgi:hypothetical protein
VCDLAVPVGGTAVKERYDWNLPSFFCSCAKPSRLPKWREGVVTYRLLEQVVDAGCPPNLA